MTTKVIKNSIMPIMPVYRKLFIFGTLFVPLGTLITASGIFMILNHQHWLLLKLFMLFLGVCDVGLYIKRDMRWFYLYAITNIFLIQNFILCIAIIFTYQQLPTYYPAIGMLLFFGLSMLLFNQFRRMKITEAKKIFYSKQRYLNDGFICLRNNKNLRGLAWYSGTILQQRVQRLLDILGLILCVVAIYFIHMGESGLAQYSHNYFMITVCGYGLTVLVSPLVIGGLYGSYLLCKATAHIHKRFEFGI